MPQSIKRSLSIALGALATTTLGGCYYGDVYGSSYASGGDCASRYGADYYDSDGYAYDDGYGYDCYDAADYSGGFAQIGFGGGWYDDYYYPGYGMWVFDSYRNRYPLRGQYLNYWGGRRAWWKHHKDRPNGGNWTPRPGQGSHDGKPGRPDRPGGWNNGDRDGPRATPPSGSTPGASPPAATNPNRPGRPSGAVRPNRPGSDGNARPPRNWSPGANGPRRPQGAPPVTRPTPAAPSATRPTMPPAARPPAARPAAPAARPTPPPRQAPAERRQRSRIESFKAQDKL